MYKRLVEDACRSGALTHDALSGFTDDGLVYYLQEHAPSPLLTALRTRALYKRVAEWPASELQDGFGEWIGSDRERTRTAEDALARKLGLAPGSVLLDFPEKTQMLGLDIPVQRRDGSIERLTARGLAGAINLPRLSEELYRSARWLRVFAPSRVSADAARVLEIIAAS